MAKRYPAHRIKIHRSYTVEEVALLLGAHAQTVRGWVQSGTLPVCGEQRPILIIGAELRAYLVRRQERAKRRLGPDEFYCLKCRGARRPAGMMADYEPQSQSAGRLVALCEGGEGLVHRIVREDKVAAAAPNLSIMHKSRAAELEAPSRVPPECKAEG